MNIQIPDTPIGRLDVALALTGLWIVADALNHAWEERAAYAELNSFGHLMNGVCFVANTLAAVAIHHGSGSLGLASLALGISIRSSVEMTISSAIEDPDE